jgi:valyl-tRNA synthetase
MPFITEEIFQSICPGLGPIMLTESPQYDKKMHFPKEAEQIEAVKEAIRAIRNVRAEMNVPPSKRVDIQIVTDLPEYFKSEFFAKLAYGNEITFLSEPPQNAVSVTCSIAQMFMAQSDLVDVSQERERLTKEKEALAKEVKMFQSKLANKNFTDKAPASVVEEHQVKLANYQNMLEKVEKQLNDLS